MVRGAGHDAGHDAVPQPLRIAHRHHGLTVLERRRVAQLQRLQSLGLDAKDGEIELAIGGVDGLDVMALAVGGFNAKGPALAEDVAIGGDQSLGGHDEAGA